jgi:uncharacterized protein (DUF2141 family)
MTLKFEIAGDRGGLYIVTAKRDGNNLTVTCNCQKSKQGDICKHRLALLHGDTRGLASENTADVKKLCDLAIGTDVEKQMLAFASSEAEY